MDIDIPLDAALAALDDAVKALKYARWALEDHDSIDPDLARKCEEAKLMSGALASATVGDAV